MKRIASIFLALLLLCSVMAVPVFAAEDFVPSVSFEGIPELVTVYDEAGNPKVGILHDADGSVCGYLDEDCLVVTPVSKVSTSTEIPADSATTLLTVYNALNTGSMALPYDKMGTGLSDENTAIRELFDVTFLCNDHPAMLEEVGVTLTLTFVLGVEADADVHVLTYKNNEWNPIQKVTNNGDGTVTCVFEHLCPVAFVVETADSGNGGGTGGSPATGDPAGNSWMLWTAAMVLSAVLIAVIIVRRKKYTAE